MSENRFTEVRNEATRGIDIATTDEILTMLNREDQQVAPAVEAELHDIGRAVDDIVNALNEGGRLIYLGAGTSGRLGVLDAAELSTAFGFEPGRIQAFLAGGAEAFFQAVDPAQDDKAMGVEELKTIQFNQKDVLVGISASGSTPYVTGALEYAKRMGGKTIALTSTKEAESGQIADIMITTLVGPEAIAGATRLKSATAHKMVLNMISTAVMIRLGRVYENLMVDVAAKNAKLIRRRNNTVAEACNISLQEAEDLLIRCQGDARLAILLGKSDLSQEEARQLLDRCQGNLRQCFLELEKK